MKEIDMRSTYFSGQGVLYVAKYLETDNGKVLGDFFHLGNAPHFSIKSEREKGKIPENDSIRIVFESINENTFDIIFGGTATVVNNDTISDIGKFKSDNKDNKILKTNWHTQNFTKNYALIFDGLNTADSNKAFRVELNNVYLRPSKRLDFIVDTLAEFEITGYFTYHKDDCAYLVVDKPKVKLDI